MNSILVVDDEIDTLHLLAMMLELSGMRPVTTAYAVDAIPLAETERVSCALVDIMMPQIDGFTLCKMMRLHPATMDLPIIFITAYTARDLHERSREAGADLVLPKPLGMDSLIRNIERAIQTRAMNASLNQIGK
jgi:CheY-like chemotaxis protein